MARTVRTIANAAVEVRDFTSDKRGPFISVGVFDAGAQLCVFELGPSAAVDLARALLDAALPHLAERS